VAKQTLVTTYVFEQPDGWGNLLFHLRGLIQYGAYTTDEAAWGIFEAVKFVLACAQNGLEARASIWAVPAGSGKLKAHRGLQVKLEGALPELCLRLAAASAATFGIALDQVRVEIKPASERDAVLASLQAGERI